MDSWGPAGITAAADTHRRPPRGPGLLRRIGGIRPQFLIALVTVLALVSAVTVYATIQSRVTVNAGAPPVATESVPAGAAGAADPRSATGGVGSLAVAH